MKREGSQALSPGSTRRLTRSSITRYRGGAHLPYAITSGPDGNLWFTDYEGSIGTFNITTHAFAEYPLGDSNSAHMAEAITTGPDGNLWFAESTPSAVGMINPTTHVITQFAVPVDGGGTGTGGVHSIVTGSDGNLWFDVGQGEIGRINPTTHVITRIANPAGSDGPSRLTSGPDGNLWFAASPTEVGVLNPTTLAVSVFPIPNSVTGWGTSVFLTSGPDGGIWFNEPLDAKVGRIDPVTHAVREYAIPSTPSFSAGITPGPGGGLWFTEGSFGLGEVHTLVLSPFTPQTVKAGDTLNLSVRATDSAVGATLTYSLDAGAPSGVSINPASGNLTWTPTVPGTYSLTVRATDNTNPPLTDSQSLTVRVQDVAPSVALNPVATTSQGSSFLESGSFASPVPGPFSATVDYGDGTGLQPLVLNPDHTFDLTHTYTISGSFTATLTVRDAFGGSVSESTRVTVKPERYSAFVTTLYQDLLGRPAEPSGLAFWRGQLVGGGSPSHIAVAIARSPERRFKLRHDLVKPVSLQTAFRQALHAARQAGHAAGANRVHGGP